jgi:hypothetical protein
MNKYRMDVMVDGELPCGESIPFKAENSLPCRELH